MRRGLVAALAGVVVVATACAVQVEEDERLVDVSKNGRAGER